VRAINVIKRIEGIPVQPGMVVPVDLTVAFPKLPTVTYGILAMPPFPEYKSASEPAYQPKPAREPVVGYA